MFLFKRKKIVVDCFTPFEHIIDLYSVQPALKFFPEKIKSMENHFEEKDKQTNITLKHATIKKCNGIIDLYKQGAIIPFWTDFISEPRNAKDGKSAIGMIEKPFTFYRHDPRQYTGLFDNYFHIKFDTPWRFREKKGINFLYTEPTWNLLDQKKNFTVVTGVITYNYQSLTHTNIIIDKDSDNFSIKPGTPLVHIIPLTEDEVVFKNHLVSIEEYKKIGIPSEYPKLHPNYYNRYVAEQKNKKSKCPFHF